MTILGSHFFPTRIIGWSQHVYRSGNYSRKVQYFKSFHNLEKVLIIHSLASAEEVDFMDEMTDLHDHHFDSIPSYLHMLQHVYRCGNYSRKELPQPRASSPEEGADREQPLPSR